MRKVILPVLQTAVLVLLLAACAGQEVVVETPVADPPAVPTVEPTAVPTLPPPVVSDLSETPATGAGDETAEPEPEPEPPAPWPPDRFGYGIQSHAVVGDPALAMDVVRNHLGLDWVKVQLEWPLVQPDPGDDVRQWFFYDGVVAEAARHNLHLMFSVVGAPAWSRAAGTEKGPPDDYNLFAEFLTELINRYPDQIHAIEVWNEMNLDREWSTANGISPEDYVELLRVAQAAIKVADPDIIVISGALSPTGPGDWVRWADDFEYMDRALAAGMLDYADCVGAHHNGYNIPPDVTAEDAPNSPQAATAVFRGPFDNPYHLWSFKTTLDTYAAKVQAIDPDMRLCVTEFGWASSEGYDAIPTGFEFAQDNTEAEQAEYIVQAFQQMYASGDVWLAFLFNLDFGNKGNGPSDDPVPYSIIRYPDGAPRPAFSAVAEMDKPQILP